MGHQNWTVSDRLRIEKDKKHSNNILSIAWHGVRDWKFKQLIGNLDEFGCKGGPRYKR